MTTRERLPELLCCPFRRRIDGYIVMEDSAGAQVHDDEYVQRRNVAVTTTKKSHAATTKTIGWRIESWDRLAGSSYGV